MAIAGDSEIVSLSSEIDTNMYQACSVCIVLGAFCTCNSLLNPYTDPVK